MWITSLSRTKVKDIYSFLAKKAINSVHKNLKRQQFLIWTVGWMRMQNIWKAQIQQKRDENGGENRKNGIRTLIALEIE